MYNQDEQKRVLFLRRGFTLADVINNLNLSITVLIAGAAIFLLGILFAIAVEVRKGTSVTKIVLAVGSVVMIAVVGWNIISLKKLDNQVEAFVDDYNLELVSYSVEEEYIYAFCKDSSTRYYDIYIIENDGTFTAYTRNEKGVYLPITGVSSDIIE